MILLPPDLSVEGVRQGLTTASNGGRGLCTVCSVHAVSVQSGPVQAHATFFFVRDVHHFKSLHHCAIFSANNFVP